MITVISGTNRPDSHTRLVASMYEKLLQKHGEKTQLFSLEEIPADFSLKDMYAYHHPYIQVLIDKYLIPVQKLVFVVPEYNGGVPGILKLFIDAVKPEIFNNKKAALIGVATGRAGNLRGMDHLTNILHYLNVEVLPYKVPVSGIHRLLNKEGDLLDEGTIAVMEKQAGQFVKY